MCRGPKQHQGGLWDIEEGGVLAVLALLYFNQPKIHDKDTDS